MDEARRRVFGGDPGGMGERLVRMVCETLGGRRLPVYPLTVILRNAVQREEAASLMSEFVEREIVGRLVAHTQDPTAALRGGLAHSAILGDCIVARYIVGVEPLASVSIDEVVRAVGPTLQRYLAAGTGRVLSAAQDDSSGAAGRCRRSAIVGRCRSPNGPRSWAGPPTRARAQPE